MRIGARKRAAIAHTVAEIPLNAQRHGAASVNALKNMMQQVYGIYIKSGLAANR
jgi:hypothetical protein